MLQTVKNIPEKVASLKSDNCSSQYKSAQHFHDIQNICNKISVLIICLDIDDLADSGAEARLKKYLIIERSNSFQVMVFQPNYTTFKLPLTYESVPLLDRLWVLFPIFLA